MLTMIYSNRLSRIRAQSARWCAQNPEAKNWDDAFLLSIIDRKQGGLRTLTKVAYLVLGFLLGLCVVIWL